MFPAFKMQWNNQGFVKKSCNLKAFIYCHSQMSIAYFFHYGCPHKNNYNFYIKSLGNFYYPVVPNRVACVINCSLSFVFKVQHKSRYRSTVAVTWPMPAWSSG